ncbi:MAG: UvrD-helicase domain-containing protein [Propionicimonas sp.]
MRRLSVNGRWLSFDLMVAGNPEQRLDGLTRREAAGLRRAISDQLARADLALTLAQARSFQSAFNGLLATHLAEQRWIPHDRVVEVLRLAPSPGQVTAAQHLPPGSLSPGEHQTLVLLAGDPWQAVRTVNAQVLAEELTGCRTFFDRVEKSPLTEEQARAVATFDNRVRVIAAAGSGKTSVMVARAAYAVARGLVPPERILMLAFNADAAAELQERVTARLGALGLPTDGLRASTFHSFGLSLIGRATGRKPSLAPWVEHGHDVEKISEIVRQLRDESETFRFKWDLFRLLYGGMSEAPDGGECDSYDRAKGLTGFATYRGETVRSEGERLIANWLFLNGVDYRYEQPYPHDVADSSHVQYRPDFYYPRIDVWHEHWALGADGKPPASFVGYEDSVRWKKAIHQRYGTRLIETTWHDVLSLRGLSDLAGELRRFGVTLDWNPDRPIPGPAPIDHERLARLMRTFLSHVKANSLTPLDLQARLQASPSPRTRLFLDLFWPIHDRWEQQLRASKLVDFDDMLRQATDLLEHDPTLNNYELILVDEFQDTSRSRARLVRALSSGREKYLLAVGDDWQAINRFAGADLTVMTHFEECFGPAQTVYLQTTFRNPQPIADVAGRFVGRNPAQLPKKVVASQPESGSLITVVRVGRQDSLSSAIEQQLRDLATSSPGSSVDILGRYRHEHELVPHRRFGGLDVRFRTMHAAKGLEADYVLLPNLTTGVYGFPSQIEDDPVLRLVLAGDDSYPYAEERRLLYVALTRARRQVTIFTTEGLESPFVAELLSDAGVRLVDAAGTPSQVRICSECGQGTMVLRRGRYGEFYGCSQFPRCTHKART